MKPTSKNIQGSNCLFQASPASSLRRIGLALATFVCGLAISGLATIPTAHAQETAGAVNVDRSSWVQIPGELIRPECVHEIPTGATVEVEDGRITGDVTMNGALLAHYDDCAEQAVISRPHGHSGNLDYPPGTGNGWVEASEWNVALGGNDDLDYMAGNWAVPSNPAKNGALIYLFNGIEPSSGAWILQPVLQYGVSPAGGGNYWAIASWLVSSSQAFYSPLEKVYAGNNIVGSTYMTGISGNTKYFTTEAQDTTTGAYSYLNAHVSGQHWTWAYAAVLEAYNVTSCSEFPSNNRVTFYNSTIAHGFPYYNVISGKGWVGAIYSYGGPSCHFMVVAGSESTLNY